MQLRSKSTLLVATLVLCGAATAAKSVLPKLWQAPVQATQEHAMVLKGVGHWQGTVSMNTGTPEPMVSEAHETVTAVGELWTTSRFESNMMGMPFVGSSIAGYDVAKKKYVGTWIDNMTTSITMMEGEYDKGKNALVMSYQGLNPMSNEMTDMRMETQMSDDSYNTKFFMNDGTNEIQMMEIKMKRVSGPIEAGSGR